LEFGRHGSRHGSKVRDRRDLHVRFATSANDATGIHEKERSSLDVSELPLPPNLGMNLYRNIRDSISYFSNPDRFVANRSARLGPIFLTYNFFKPTVICGGQANVQEFISGTELKSKVIHPALPDIFMELHTKWGTLNLDANDNVFKESRRLFADVLSSLEASKQYAQAADQEIEEFVINLEKRVRSNPGEPIYLVPELKSLCLQIFAKIFSGEGLTKEQEQQFMDYNNALLSITRNSGQYKKGRAALDDLKEIMLHRFHKLDDPNLPIGTPGKWYHDQVYGRKNFDDDDRIGTGIVLFVWGAYIECASLMIDSVAMMVEHEFQDSLINIREELDETRKATANIPTSDYTFWSQMPYTLGVLRETLRLEPPGAGVPRFSHEDFALAGYRIPSGVGVMMEPRIGNNDPSLYPYPEKFEPMRWAPKEKQQGVSASEESQCPFRGTALKNGPGSWFPGGFGAHKCPGVPLAELVGKMFLVKLATRFDSWEFSGQGLDNDGKIKYVLIPVKIPPDNFGLVFRAKE